MASFSSNILTTIIASGASLGSIVNIGDNAVVAIQASIAMLCTFQGSMDGTTYYNICDVEGDDYSATTLGSTSLIVLDLNYFLAPLFIKIRYGTSSVPITASSAIAIQLITKEI